MDHYATTDRDKTVRMLIGGIGIVFILAGLYGFVDPTFFGIFDLTTSHNWVHVLTGALYAILAFAPVELSIVAWVARIGGIFYALLGVVGFFAPDILAPLLHLGTNENIFHLLIGTAIAVLGFLLPVHTGTHAKSTAGTTGHRR